MNTPDGFEWHNISFVINGGKIEGIKPILNYKPKPMKKPTIASLQAEMSRLRNKDMDEKSEREKDYEKVIEDLKGSITEFSKEISDLAAKNEAQEKELKELHSFIEGELAKEKESYKLDIPCLDKQVSINILKLCKDNDVKNPLSMTITETKKVLFFLKNIFQEAKGFGE